MAKFRQSFLVKHVFGWTTRLLALASLLALAARACPAWLSSIPYLPDLAALTPWFIFLSLLALILALMASRWFTALVLIAALALNVYWQYPFYQEGSELNGQADQLMALEHPDRYDDVARVMTLNVYKGQADADQVVKTVSDNRVEVLALQEVSEDFVDRLHKAGIDRYLPHEQLSTSSKEYANGLWTAAPMQSPSKDDVGSRSSMMPAASIDFDRGKTSVRFVSVHTTSPQPGSWNAWRRSVSDLGKLRKHEHTRYVLLGDFNATYDHAVFRDMLGERFSDGARQAGHGMSMTWPANRAPLPRLVAIDHVVVDRDIRANRLQTIPIDGSDHAALLATVMVE